MSRPLVVTCGIIQREDLILAARRADSGLWELPGGKARAGETLKECLARELAEELGVQVAVGEPFAVAREEGLELHSFFCRVTKGEPRPLEHLELCWLTPARFAGLKLCGPDRELAEALKRRQNPAPTKETGHGPT